MEPKEQIVIVITYWEDDPESGWKPTNPKEDEERLTVEVYRRTKSFFAFEEGMKMGDNRFDVKITLIGADGKPYRIDWSVNWWPDKPEKLYRAIIELARNAGLEVDSDFDPGSDE